MKRISYKNAASFIIIAFAAVAIVSSCKKKEEKPDIYIAPVEKKEVNNKPKVSGDETKDVEIEWVGYNCKITRTHIEDKAVTDNDGNKYYDNTVNISITHGDASVFNRTFKASDFSAYINDNYLKPDKRILVDIAYNNLVDGNATFMATIGNPDPDSDEFMSVQIAVDRNGGMTMKSMKSLNGDNEGSKEEAEPTDASQLSNDFVGD